jgi:hypothetical protein
VSSGSKGFLKMRKPQETVDMTNLSISEQISRVDEAINETQYGVGTTLLTSSQMVATYALPKSLKKNIKCKISPSSASGEWKLDIRPQI